MVTLTTDTALLTRLESARNHVMTDEEFKAQRASWVWGQLPISDPRTVEEIREQLDARP